MYKYTKVYLPDLVSGQTYYIDNKGDDTGEYVGTRFDGKAIAFVGDNMPHYGKLNGEMLLMSSRYVFTRELIKPRRTP